MLGCPIRRVGLQQLYGEEGVLNIENVPDGGVRARVQLPFNTIEKQRF